MCFPVVHALVIGGTGMLSNLSLWLAERYHTVTVVGRKWEKLEAIVELAGPLSDRIVPLSVDYTDKEKLVKAIRLDLWRNGPLELCVAWIRRQNVSSLVAAAREISEHTKEEWRLFHIKGSRVPMELNETKLPENVILREVTLGFMIENGVSRWLSHEEICGGIIDAIEKNSRNAVVGLQEPTDRMPP